MKRRRFLVAGSAAVLSTGLALWFRARSKGAHDVMDPRLKRDPKGVLDLHEGFTYSVISRVGDPMNDGYRVPGRPDAMGCFDLGKGRYALMRNHELDSSVFAFGPYKSGQSAPPEAYDKKSFGGVTRVVLDTNGKVLSQNLVLVGTARNCAGGMSPWGWLTCEESVEPGHGYVFLCSTRAEQVRAPQRISSYGRFLHEAVAIDETTLAAYLTEDRKNGCLYRFVPENPAEPHGKGLLQALMIKDQPRFNLGEGLPDGATFEVRWVNVPPEAGERDDALREAAQERGAAIVYRGEGITRVSDGVVFTSTQGGALRAGQVFHLAPTAEGGTLKLLAESRNERDLDMPDNITVTPWGDLLVCEDNNRTSYLRLITRAGNILPFARNALSGSEFAGACFAPDGRTLFVNLQMDGMTLAIQGPFEKFAST